MKPPLTLRSIAAYSVLRQEQIISSIFWSIVTNSSQWLEIGSSLLTCNHSEAIAASSSPVASHPQPPTNPLYQKPHPKTLCCNFTLDLNWIEHFHPLSCWLLSFLTFFCFSSLHEYRNTKTLIAIVGLIPDKRPQLVPLGISTRRQISSQRSTISTLEIPDPTGRAKNTENPFDERYNAWGINAALHFEASKLSSLGIVLRFLKATLDSLVADRRGCSATWQSFWHCGKNTSDAWFLGIRRLILYLDDLNDKLSFLFTLGL